MATTRDKIKQWFQAGARPTAAHFAAWIDSFFHKDDKIPYASVAGLDDALADKVSKSDLGQAIYEMEDGYFTERGILPTKYVDVELHYDIDYGYTGSIESISPTGSELMSLLDAASVHEVQIMVRVTSDRLVNETSYIAPAVVYCDYANDMGAELIFCGSDRYVHCIKFDMDGKRSSYRRLGLDAQVTVNGNDEAVNVGTFPQSEPGSILIYGMEAEADGFAAETGASGIVKQDFFRAEDGDYYYRQTFISDKTGVQYTRLSEYVDRFGASPEAWGEWQIIGKPVVTLDLGPFSASAGFMLDCSAEEFDNAVEAYCKGLCELRFTSGSGVMIPLFATPWNGISERENYVRLLYNGYLVGIGTYADDFDTQTVKSLA